MLDLPRGCFTVTPRTVKEGGASDFFVVPNLLDWASVNGMLVLLRGYDGYDWARTAWTQPQGGSILQQGRRRDLPLQQGRCWDRSLRLLERWWGLPL